MMKPIILGAGLAGLSTALALAPLPVVLISPCKLGIGCSSAWAQGGIAASVGAEDRTEYHARDTLQVGSGLNDEVMVQKLVEDAPSVIKKLTALGVDFDRDEEGLLHLGMEAAHSHRRIVHAKDATGSAIMKALVKAVHNTPSIEIIENTIACDLIVKSGIRGVVLSRNNKEFSIQTSRVVLATGGAGSLWNETTNPLDNWGSGLALAARAGATLGDMEFMQFHPTALSIGRTPMPLASEALRGEGATLIDETGEQFTNELQARDIVARAVWEHIACGHHVFLDARQSIGNAFEEKFPTIFAACISAGIDPTCRPIPIRPAAHYHMGGVLTDAHGRTDLVGLWACGEVACTGVHGANRLASNSLLEAASFGSKVAEDIASDPPSFSGQLGSQCQTPLARPLIQEEKNQIRAIMSKYVSVVRDRSGLQQAIALLTPLAQYSDMALTALIITEAALRREESRGAHFRKDFPQTLPTAQRSRFQFTNRKHADAA